MIYEPYKICRKVVILMAHNATDTTSQTANRYFVFRGTRHFPTNARIGDKIQLPLYEYLADTPYRELNPTIAITYIESYPTSKLLRGTTYLDETTYQAEILLHQNDTFANLVTLIPMS